VRCAAVIGCGVGNALGEEMFNVYWISRTTIEHIGQSYCSLLNKPKNLNDALPVSMLISESLTLHVSLLVGRALQTIKFPATKQKIHIAYHQKSS